LKGTNCNHTFLYFGFPSQDEADILSDRIAILNNGRVQTCGSGLFLKHQIAGYNLKFNQSTEPIDIGNYVENALLVEGNKGGGAYNYSLQHGTETSFARALRALNQSGATDVSLELTSLEQVFLATEKETRDTDSEGSSQEESTEGAPTLDVSTDLLRNVWDPPNTKKMPLSERGKILLVNHFMLTKAWRIKGIIFFNVIQPLLYIIIGLVSFSGANLEESELINPSPISVSPFLSGQSPSQFFGVSGFEDGSIYPLVPTEEPQSVVDYFQEGSIPFLGGFWESNQTLQYNETLSPFALQVGVQVVGDYTALLSGFSDIMSVRLVQLPYTTNPFRVDMLLLPMLIALGFSGLVFSVLDVLLLKGDKIIDLWRTSGITEWRAFQGVMLYKTVTTFAPFFIVVLGIGSALGSVLMGR